MRSYPTRYTALLASGLLTVLSGGTTYADDTEIFLAAPGNAAAPNIMLILDTSGSMGSQVTTTVEYNPAQSYSGSGDCSGIGDRVYYSTNGGVPGCGSNNWFLRSDLKCAAALASNALGNGGSGIYINRFVRWGGNNNNRSWRSQLSPNNAREVECQADNGVDGNLTTSNPYPAAGSSNNTSGVWVNNASSSYWATGNGVAATLYTGNYITFWNQHRSTTLGSRMSIMRNAATNLLNSLSGVNIGLMRYSNNVGDGDQLARGGMVAYPVSPIDQNRTQLINAVNAYTADGFTPLSETLFEAYRYFSGGAVHVGDFSVPFESVAASRTIKRLDGGNYDSPSDYSCQKNYVIYLTDGLPTADSEANSMIQALPDFATVGGTCDATSPSSDWTNAGLCLVPLSRYMANTDMRTDVPGEQNVISHWIGFGEDVANGTPFEYLTRAAQAGGGRAYAANDAADLTSVLTSIALELLETSTTFTAPSVAVNAFNRTRSLSDLYVSVFRPSPDRHWPGNLKKYRVKTQDDGTALVVGQNEDVSAIDDQTGFFVEEARSLWLGQNDGADGPEVRKGGAAAKLPLPGERNVYTFLGANPGAPVTLSGSVNYQVSADNTALTSAVLGLGATGDPTRENVIAWARGQDVLDEYPWETGPNGDRTERRFAMGDPIHTQPALVIYGGTTSSPNLDDAVAFVPTNDGYLHAVDAATGVELWSFIPQEFLPNLRELYLNNVTGAKNYTLDGEIRVLKFDVNGDGIVQSSAGDRVFLYFGQGRGGSSYYALDVTTKNAPKFMWRISDSQLTGLGQAWSTPSIARVNIAGATQNLQKLVLVIGGGYDSIEDNGNFTTSNSVGNRIFMIDAVRGTLLWSAGPSGANLNLPRMTHSIPSHVSVLDTNADGYADRMYVGDMAAQLWRFDIHNGQAAGTLVTGGVLASLGAKDAGTVTDANTRRFYNQPDVAAIQRQGAASFLNIAIGSGYRGHPLRTTTHDRFYSIRDYRPFQAMTQAEYDALTVLTDASLVDVTNDMAPAIPPAGPGWKLLLNQPNGTWRGEKSLGQATTINNNIVFTSYTPTPPSATNPCAATYGMNRAYRVRVLDGAPVRIDGAADPADRYEDFTFGGIATDISTMILGEPEPCVGDNCPQPEPCEGEDCPAPNRTQFVCLAGVRVLDICRDFNSRVKTYWREQTAN